MDSPVSPFNIFSRRVLVEGACDVCGMFKAVVSNSNEFVVYALMLHLISYK